MYKLQKLNSLYSNSKLNRPEDEVWNIWKHKHIYLKCFQCCSRGL